MADQVVALAGGLPKHDSLNGLVSIAGEAVGTPDETWVVVAVLNVKKITTNVDNGDVTPTFRVVRIEPIGDDADKAYLGRIASRAHERRTGKAVLPLDLEDEIREAFGTGRLGDGDDD